MLWCCFVCFIPTVNILLFLISWWCLAYVGVYIIYAYTYRKIYKNFKSWWKLYREDSWKTRIIDNVYCAVTNLSEYENLNTERIFIYKNYCYHKTANLSTIYNKLLLIITTIWKIVIIGILLLTKVVMLCYLRITN